MRKFFLLLLLCVLFIFNSTGRVAATSPALTDISQHWAQQDIEKALQSGWVNGYPDKSFRPDATITRAEFVKLLMSAMHLTPEIENWDAETKTLLLPVGQVKWGE